MVTERRSGRPASTGDSGPPSVTRRQLLTRGALGAVPLLIGGTLGTRTAAAATPEETTIDRVKRTGVLNLGVRETTPPYGWLNEQNKFVGFSTEIAEKAHARLELELKTKIKINYVPVTGRTRIPLLQNKTIDMEAGATVIAKSRVKVVDFSAPFFLTATFVLVPADSPVKRIEDLSGKRVGGHRGGLEETLYTKKLISEGVLKRPVQFIGFEGHPEGFTALQGGSIDAYSSDGPILYGLHKSAPDPAKWRVFDPEVDVFGQAFPIRQNSSTFATLINLTIVELSESGQWDELYQKYFVPVGLPRNLPENLKFLKRLNAWPA